MKLLEDIQFIKYTVLGWVRDSMGFHGYIGDRIESVQESLMVGNVTAPQAATEIRELINDRIFENETH